jgi:hypothetical protein
VSITGAESGLPFVAFGYSNKVVGAFQIQFREVASGAESVKSLGYQWQGAAVLDGDLVQGSVVYTKSKFATLLGYEEDWRSSWGFGASDETLLQVFVKVFSKSFKLFL